MPWYVLYTRPRNEKLVAANLRALGIDVYCPLILAKRQWSDRVKLVEQPLFTSYCFVNLEEKERSRVFGVQGVVRYLFWQKQAAVVRDVEIEAIKCMLNEVDSDQIQIRTYRPGDALRIVSGSFADVYGTVLHQQGKVVHVLLPSLQITLTVDLSKTLVA